MKAVVYQVPREFAATPEPGPGSGPGRVRLRRSGHGHPRIIATQMLELDEHAHALSALVDNPADLKAVLAP
jgi:hypothetical protein